MPAATAPNNCFRRSPWRPLLAKQKSFLGGGLLSRCYIFSLCFSAFLFIVVLNLRLYVHLPLSHRLPNQQWPSFVLRHWGAEEENPESGDCTANLANATARLRNMVTFLPLKDARLKKTPMEGSTWFMSSVNDTPGPGDLSKYLHFPSAESSGQILCLAGGSKRDGTRSSYAFAWPDALPNSARLLPGLTFVSHSYYDYYNPWHAQGALLPFVGWHRWRGCVRPARWVLYHRGELSGMGKWVEAIASAVFGCGKKQEGEADVPVLGPDAFPDGTPVCFQETVVFRHIEGSISKGRRRELYDVIRDKARRRCGIDAVTISGDEIRLTLFLRTGSRSFRNDSIVIETFDRECRNFPGCRLTVSRPNNLTFCEQVRLMASTDILATQHGAQLTNMIFMDKNSSVMEFFPKGWLDLAGRGQNAHRWLANNAGMRHEGTWRDEDINNKAKRYEALPCPHPKGDIRCFLLIKDGTLGFNGTYVAAWTKKILQQVKQRKLEERGQRKVTTISQCPCE